MYSPAVRMKWRLKEVILSSRPPAAPGRRPAGWRRSGRPSCAGGAPKSAERPPPTPPMRPDERTFAARLRFAARGSTRKVSTQCPPRSGVAAADAAGRPAAAPRPASPRGAAGAAGSTRAEAPSRAPPWRVRECSKAALVATRLPAWPAAPAADTPPAPPAASAAGLRDSAARRALRRNLARASPCCESQSSGEGPLVGLHRRCSRRSLGGFGRSAGAGWATASPPACRPSPGRCRSAGGRPARG